MAGLRQYCVLKGEPEEDPTVSGERSWYEREIQWLSQRESADIDSD